MITTTLSTIMPLAAVAEEAKDYVNGLDTLWVLLGAMLVFWMQPGFALVEAGMTRSKNTANILMKNFCDFMCGSHVRISSVLDSWFLYNVRKRKLIHRLGWFLRYWF